MRQYLFRIWNAFKYLRLEFCTSVEIGSVRRPGLM